MLKIVDIRQRPELLRSAVQYFWKQWGMETNLDFYRDCIERSMVTDSVVPRFYVMLDGERIVGGYALLQSDLNSRQDLFPWFGCLHVDSEYRGQNLGGWLLKHGVQETHKIGLGKLYLCTDLIGYYEKHGWIYNGKGYLFNGDEVRIYEYSI